jgi:hypothetical protein
VTQTGDGSVGAGPEEINAMKRVPPSVQLKEEINGMLQRGEREAGAIEAPMVGFVGRLAR